MTRCGGGFIFNGLSAYYTYYLRSLLERASIVETYLKITTTTAETEAS